MRRTRPGLLLAAVVALVLLTGLSGCDAGRPPAAKVGQSEISSATLIEDLQAEAARAKATDSSSTPERDVEDTYSAAAAAELLGRRIRYELLGEVLKARDITVTDEERNLAEQSLCTGGSNAQVPEGECPGLKGYPSYYRTFQIELAARGNAYSAAITNARADAEAIRKLYEDLKADDPDQLQVQCYRAASVPDEGVVSQIQVGVAAGQSFEDAVGAVEGAQINPDTQCDPAVVIPAEVIQAEEGVVLGPFPTQGGQFVIQVEERRAGTLEEVTGLLQQQISQQNEQDAVEELLTKAEVSVNPQYGRWNRSTGTVDPPKGPTPATTDSVPASS